MRIPGRGVLAALMIAVGLAVAAAGAAHAQAAGETLKTARGVRCEFRNLATGTWARNGTPTGRVTTQAISVAFANINLEVATADVDAKLGAVYAIAQFSGTSLHFILVGSAGYVHTTTVFDAPGRPGRFKAVHSRHEYNDVALPGYTSRPEQYYGDCEVIR